jgi:hypothetical protein
MLRKYFCHFIFLSPDTVCFSFLSQIWRKYNSYKATYLLPACIFN